MLLTVMERILVQTLIPKEGNFTNIKLIRKAREALSFTEEENKILQFRTEGSGPETRSVWNNVPIDRDIDLGETVTGMVVEELKRLSGINKLPVDHISLYEKFVETGD